MRNRTIYGLLVVLILAMLVSCGVNSNHGVAPTSSDPPTGSSILQPPPIINEETSGSSEGINSSDGLNLNKAILKNLNRPFSDILKEEPNLKPKSLDDLDAAAMCFVDPSKSYSYILFVTQYLPYDEYAAEAIQQRDIRCAGIYTTVGELFPDFIDGESPEACFDKSGVEDFSSDESGSWGIAYYVNFNYEGMAFFVFSGTADSPAVVRANDTVTVGIPTNNEELINDYYNEKVYPGGIGFEAAKNRAKEYRIAHGGSDCTFSIGRDGVIDAWEGMNLPDKKVYIVTPNLDWKTSEAEKSPVYYIGFTSGEVYERHTMAD